MQGRSPPSRGGGDRRPARTRRRISSSRPLAPPTHLALLSLLLLRVSAVAAAASAATAAAAKAATSAPPPTQQQPQAAIPVGGGEQRGAGDATTSRVLLAAPDEDLLPGWHADQQQPGWGAADGAAAAPGAAAKTAAATTADPKLELPLPARDRPAAGQPAPNPARLLAQQLAFAAAAGADVAAGPPGAATGAGTAGAVATRLGEQAEAERRDHLRLHPRDEAGGRGFNVPQPRTALGAEPFSPDMLITITEQLEQARTLANLSVALATARRAGGRGGANGGGAPSSSSASSSHGAPLTPAAADLLPPPLSQAQLARANPLLGPLGPLKPKPQAPPESPEAWPDGYLAICAVVKDQARDLREWVEYHRHVGVRKIYVYDNNSTVPLAASIADHLREGAVEYSYFVGRKRWRDLFRTTSQWWAYNDCVARFAHRHRWLAFIDVDEFIVFEAGATEPPPFLVGEEREGEEGGEDEEDEGAGAPSNPSGRRRRRALTPALVDANDFLRDYERFGALAVNWRIFGSSGHDTRPAGGVLSNYRACVPTENVENSHVKVIANTAHVLTVGDDPHTVVFKHEGATTVDELGRPVKGARTAVPSLSRVALYHYLTKSRAEYGAKMARGSAAGNHKDVAFFDAVNALATDTCARAVDLGKRCCPSVLADLHAADQRHATERAALQAEAIAEAWPAGGIAGDGVGGIAAGRAAAARAVAALPAPPGYDEEATGEEDHGVAFGAPATAGGGGHGGGGGAFGGGGGRGGGGNSGRDPRAEADAVDRLLDPSGAAAAAAAAARHRHAAFSSGGARMPLAQQEEEEQPSSRRAVAAKAAAAEEEEQEPFPPILSEADLIGDASLGGWRARDLPAAETRARRKQATRNELERKTFRRTDGESAVAAAARAAALARE